ncbi:MAG: hypothetical protein AAF629_00185 [Chloroflexota bacterium]
MKQLFAKDKLVKTVGIAAAALTLSVVTIIGAVSAQEPTDEGQTGRRGQGRNSELRAYLQEVDARGQVKAAMAEVLGVSVEELEAAKEEGQSIRDLAEANEVDRETLQAAKKDVMTEILAQAVADEVITQEQADQFAERAGRGFGGKGKRGGKGFGNIIDREEMKSAVAEALGLSVEELEAAKEAGQSIRDLAEAQGIELSDIQEAKKAALTEAIEEAVSEGTITQAQADQMLERIENGNFGRGRRGSRGNGDGFRGGFGGPRGGDNAPADSGTSL